jgi:hypothetical protein
MDITELIGEQIGLFDSANGNSLEVDKVLDVTAICPHSKQVVIKYTTAVRGRIAQLNHWYEKGVDLGTQTHFFINEFTPEELAKDEVFKGFANEGDPLLLSKLIHANQ